MNIKKIGDIKIFAGTPGPASTLITYKKCPHVTSELSFFKLT